MLMHRHADLNLGTGMDTSLDSDDLKALPFEAWSSDYALLVAEVHICSTKMSQQE